MKLLAFVFVLLGYLNFSACDFQVTALYEIKMMLNDSRGVLEDWMDNQVSPCYFSYVVCQDNNVTGILLSSSGLFGVLAPSIGKLTSLQQLLLDRNSIYGPIPESIGRLSKLRNLDLSQNFLSGNIPSSTSNLSSLINISLAHNGLSGEIPAQLFQVSQYDFTGNLLNCGRGQDSIPCERETNVGGGRKHKTYLWVGFTVVPIMAVFFCWVFFFELKERKAKDKQILRDRSKVYVHRDEELVWRIEGANSEFTFFEFSQVLKATSNFSNENKLGQGGFGPVYKGQFPDGLEIAVKRLASHSGQGFVEFKNEVQLIAKLQHRNLVRLLGYCSQGEEKMLVYEYLPNKSLDFFIFDETRRALLNWSKRLAIIEGIAQGLLYLHKHSRLRVIHRDIKASNILLDSEMNPKISDFGLAKMCSSNDTEGNTKRVVGTYGYMAPEYASEGLFSVKSDVFSFGVLVLEIIIGKRNSGFHQYEDFFSLAGYAWQLWKEERWLQLVDPSLDIECRALGITRCINIALLCVQENAADRPTMTDVVAMLSSESIILTEPKHPAYFHITVDKEEASTIVESCSVNDVTMSTPQGR